MGDEKEATERKTVKLTRSAWERIATYRFEHRIATETEAVQRLIDAGLAQAERNRKRRMKQ